MAVATTIRHGQTFNKKSSIIVNGGTTAPYFDTRVNNSIPTTATSGQIEARLNDEFRHVYFYGSPSGTY